MAQDIKRRLCADPRPKDILTVDVEVRGIKARRDVDDRAGVLAQHKEQP